jgi:hypothetical protein
LESQGSSLTSEDLFFIINCNPDQGITSRVSIC